MLWLRTQSSLDKVLNTNGAFITVLELRSFTHAESLSTLEPSRQQLHHTSMSWFKLCMPLLLNFSSFLISAFSVLVCQTNIWNESKMNNLKSNLTSRSRADASETVQSESALLPEAWIRLKLSLPCRTRSFTHFAKHYRRPGYITPIVQYKPCM